jgi:hypothetical protein
MANASVFRHWLFLFYFKGTPSWILQKIFSAKLFVMWERIGEALQVACEVLHTIWHQ